MRAIWLACAAAGLAAAACDSQEPAPARRASLSEAYCQASIEGLGVVDVETDYLPRVVQCENGAAGFEALKAQAVAARSYLYYRLDKSGEIEDGQQDQVYGCGRPPSPLAHAAVRATSGQVLVYHGVQVAGFYVAGAKHRRQGCLVDPDTPASLRDDPYGTEHYVTYNAGRAGDEVTQSTLGMIHPKNRSNRGAKSQNGAACLAAQGWSYEQILHFYYGDDIELAQTDGPCVVPVSERGRTAGLKAGAWVGAMALLLALILGWVLVMSGARERRRSRR
ncbi:SpoIID/LytB domain-containing protein [Haliangium sp.]|uniref:SpoIID/LytB domain-containing protein n=1 Tax=Haliangium sp. TaxID=2663208 RepID=UPI003D10D80C